MSTAGLPRVAVGRDGVFYATSELLPTAGAMKYAPNGTYLGTFGGTGPGELQHVMRLAIAPDGTIVLHDRANGPQLYTTAGSFVRSVRQIPLSITNLVVIADTLLAVVGATRPASALATTRESVARAFGRLRSQGIIDQEGAKVRIRDLARLQDAAGRSPEALGEALLRRVQRAP